jgi:hypothetical protein
MPSGVLIASAARSWTGLRREMAIACCPLRRLPGPLSAVQNAQHPEGITRSSTADSGATHEK